MCLARSLIVDPQQGAIKQSLGLNKNIYITLPEGKRKPCEQGRASCRPYGIIWVNKHHSPAEIIPFLPWVLMSWASSYKHWAINTTNFIKLSSLSQSSAAGKIMDIANQCGKCWLSVSSKNHFNFSLNLKKLPWKKQYNCFWSCNSGGYIVHNSWERGI